MNSVFISEPKRGKVMHAFNVEIDGRQWKFDFDHATFIMCPPIQPPKQLAEIDITGQRGKPG